MERGDDGYFHPNTVEQLSQLVAGAGRGGVPVRVRGAGHSVAGAVHADGYAGKGPPPQSSATVMLDRMRGLEVTPLGDGSRARVVVEAGCNLGMDAYDPTGTSTWENSLSYRLAERGYALDNLGGISHQTVAGFLSTGSAGGSIRHTVFDDVEAIELVDASGVVRQLSKDDADPSVRELFHAAGVSLGLLGVITKVTFQVGKTYNVAGQEVSGRFDDIGIDLLGDGAPGKPSLAEYLETTPYARILWWPQKDFDRVQKWECGRLEPTADFEPEPFRILTPSESLLGSLLMTIIGNADDLSKVPDKLGPWYQHLEDAIDGEDGAKPVTMDGLMLEVERRFKGAIHAHPGLSRGVEDADDDVKKVLDVYAGRSDDDDGWEHWFAAAITKIIRLALDGALDGVTGKALGAVLRRYMPSKIDELLGVFVEDGTKQFSDWWWRGLPMDNQMDDELWDTHFTELWIGIERAKEAMVKLREYYAAAGDLAEAYRRTRAYAIEIYAAPKSPFWLSPSCAGSVVRLNPFWFGTWSGSPGEFFKWFWEELAPLGWRPHWGKHLPAPSDTWRAYYRRQFPKLERFLELRAQLDPAQTFMSDYWRRHLGIAG